MVNTIDITTDGNPILKQEYGLALGRVTNTKGSVWTYRMGHVQQNRPSSSDQGSANDRRLEESNQ
jgi:hypothetical protein